MRIGEEQPDEELNLREKTQSVNKACMYIYTSGTTGTILKGTIVTRALRLNRVAIPITKAHVTFRRSQEYTAPNGFTCCSEQMDDEKLIWSESWRMLVGRVRYWMGCWA